MPPASLPPASYIRARATSNWPLPYSPQGGFQPRFWAYLAAAALIAAGTADFALLAYHLGRTAIFDPAGIPVHYAFAMAIDAVAARILGRLFDRIGIGAMILATLASMLAAPFAFLGGSAAVAIGLAFWGIGMGAQESVMRAAIASLAAAERRGTAYGIFNAAYGLAWLAGSALLGLLYDWSIDTLVGVSVLLQAAAVPILWTLVTCEPAVTAHRQNEGRGLFECSIFGSCSAARSEAARAIGFPA